MWWKVIHQLAFRSSLPLLQPSVVAANGTSSRRCADDVVMELIGTERSFI